VSSPLATASNYSRFTDLARYRANQKTPQHENDDISEMREYFCTKFTVQKCAALCCIYLTYAELKETQTSRTNFATVQAVQKADFSWFYYWSNRVPNNTFVAMSLWRRRNYLVYFEKKNIFFYVSSHNRG